MSSKADQLPSQATATPENVFPSFLVFLEIIDVFSTLIGLSTSVLVYHNICLLTYRICLLEPASSGVLPVQTSTACDTFNQQPALQPASSDFYIAARSDFYIAAGIFFRGASYIEICAYS